MNMRRIAIVVSLMGLMLVLAPSTNFATAGPRQATPPTIGDTDPPQTTIQKHPKKKTDERTAVFKYSSDEPSAEPFECKLDKQGFKPCPRSKPPGRPVYKKTVKAGKHKFEVRATDAAGNTDPTPAKFKWTVTG